ncbi:MAG: MBL fold metallo-hydrolase [Burkholderiales bacterium GWF1_66_17]|uniref:quinoprotein relay system zinc metallohydrolase 1 n=2 Tax=Hydrogenophaga sp. TaxID=1904254 RepID=UPI0008B7A035|nr:quinoprotein relay system zinc metallohydrolase 1 [Hydrogenophaga sp.]OGA76636.1 MAG: MBL fold metallo-hydrolase [Burkholderiales bacterium GWE1_65_30]OGA91551.1 MAG: MBL fold metallo-hydrolase [Burkholderiales bacterium GWF1_66_17]
MKRWLLFTTLALAGAAQAQSIPVPPMAARPDAATFNYDLQPRQIAEGTWVIEGAVQDFSRANGCNIINTAFIATGAGVVVINTGPSRLYGEQQRRAIERVTREPVVRVLELNLHPDYFFGNQAWADRPTQALAGSIAGMQAEGTAYADNLYRLCGDWMRGTESTPARETVLPQTLQLGQHQLELKRLHGHTADDLVLLDHRTGVLFAGGLVFAERVPTTPHADFAAWQASLDALEQWHASGAVKQVVPSHGPVHSGLAGVQQTRDWLRWLTALMQESAGRGLDLGEVLETPVPERFARWAAQPAELHRSLTQWYPRYELRVLVAPGAR